MSTAPLEESSSWHFDLNSIVSSESLRQIDVPVLLSSSRFVSKRASFSAIKPQKRKMNDITDLTIDKLRFERVALHGRQKEISKLDEEYQSLVRADTPERRVLLISGTSGTGKTKLAETLEHHASQSNGLFVKGKYDLGHRSQPYSGITNACAEICGSILDLQRQEPDRATAICDEIESTVGDELPLLFQAIPILGEILHKPDPVREMRLLNSSKSLSSQKSKNRVLFAFVRFMRVITKYFAPLVFVIDDLQWADTSSLDLLEALIADRDALKLMLVGIYRSNEVDETHIMTSFLNKLESRSSCSNDLSLTRLEIENLNIQDVQHVIQDLLQCEDSPRSRELAEICHEKTNGNPFFLIRFISMLHDRQLVQFNYGSLSWTWNGEAIKAGTTACDNVVQLLQGQMNMLPGHLLELLKLASTLGSTFDYRYIEIAWRKSSSYVAEGDDDDACLEALDELSRAGFLVRVSSEQQRFSWIHDKIREAATTLIPESERCLYMREIGQILLNELTEEELDSIIFVVVDLLNFSHIHDLDTDGRRKLSDLNLMASKKAVKLSSFESAAKYAGKGIELLEDDAWDEDHYMLPLQLYSIGAKAEGFLGNHEVMEQYCKTVISKERLPLDHKLEVYSTWVEGLSDRSRVAEAAALTIEVLGKCKCGFPNTQAIVKADIMTNLFLVKTKLRSRDPSKLPTMNDDTRVELMKILDQLMTLLYALNDRRMPLIILRNLLWTFKYGICTYSAPGFASTGMILTGVLHDIQGGAAFGQHALSVLKNTQSNSTASRTIFLVHTFLFSWTRPIREGLKPLLQAYDIGFQSGDTESATFAIYQWLVYKFILGASLESLEADIDLYLRQMNDLKKAQAVKLTSTLRQVVLNLMRKDNVDDPTRFYGKGLTEEQYDVARSQPCWNAGVCRFHGVLLTYFGQHIRQADAVVEHGHDYLAKAQVATPCVMQDTYLKGVSCFAAARETGKGHYAKLGEICRSKMKKWIRKGNPNVRHYEALLDAEAMAWQGKHKAAVKYFEGAILLSGRGGYQHELAFASERLGEFQLYIMKDTDEGVYRLKEALRYWRCGGAHAKVDSLEHRNAHVFGLEKSTDIIGLHISVSSRYLDGRSSVL